MATYPHEVIRTRLQNQTRHPKLDPASRYHGIVHAAQTIWRVEGAAAFYQGFTTNLIRTVPSNALTLLTYEVIVRWLRSV